MKPLKVMQSGCGIGDSSGMIRPKDVPLIELNSLPLVDSQRMVKQTKAREKLLLVELRYYYRTLMYMT